jgi:hypothetical protein
LLALRPLSAAFAAPGGNFVTTGDLPVRSFDASVVAKTSALVFALILSWFGAEATAQPSKPQYTICSDFSASDLRAAVSKTQSILQDGLIHHTAVQVFILRPPRIDKDAPMASGCDFFLDLDISNAKDSSFTKWMFTNKPQRYWDILIRLKRLPQAGSLQECRMTEYESSSDSTPDANELGWTLVGAILDALESAASKAIMQPWLEKPVRRTKAGCR